VRPDRRLVYAIRSAPLVFLIHDVEEIVTMAPWLRAHRTQLPAIVQPLTTVTTMQFALAVGILFVGVVLATAHGMSRARRGMKSIPFLLVAGALVANGATHVLQAIYFRGYVPGVVTAVLLVLNYGVILGQNFERSGLVRRRTWLGTIALGGIIQVPIVVALLLAVRSSL
jgi:hypothetical protein